MASFKLDAKACIMAMASGATIAGALLVALGIGLIVTVSLISSALNSILLGALYLYASDGEVPQQFDRELFQNAFVTK